MNTDNIYEVLGINCGRPEMRIVKAPDPIQAIYAACFPSNQEVISVKLISTNNVQDWSQ